MCGHIMMYCTYLHMYQWICLVHYTAPIVQSPSAGNLSLQFSEEQVPIVNLSEIPDDTLGKCI